MTEENVPSSGYEDVYEAMGIKDPFHGLDERDEGENFAGDVAAFREREEYRSAKEICQELEGIYEQTDMFPILMVDGEGMMPVALGRYDKPSQVHPDFYIDATDSNLDAVDLVFAESDYGSEMMDMFDETVSEVPDIAVEHRKPFDEDGILQGGWLAPGIDHLYDLDAIQEEREGFDY